MKGFAFERVNFCGSQIVPRDLHPGLTPMTSPDDRARPLMLDMGMYDDCFFIHDTLKGYEGVKRIYEAADSAEPAVEARPPQRSRLGRR